MNSYKRSNGPGKKNSSLNPLFGDNGRVPQRMLDRNIAINAYTHKVAQRKKETSSECDRARLFKATERSVAKGTRQL